MPTATDLVTDLPADFEVFGQAVDTRIKALNPNTTLGDLNYGSATANTNTRLPIGTTGQVLSVVGGVPSWQNPSAGDIEGVTAGVGISGGGTSGTVTVTNSMATAITTNGDLIYGTGSGTFTRRGIGSTDQVLTVSGGVPTWATLPPASSMTSLASGNLPTGASSLNLTSISGSYTDLRLVISNWRTNSSGDFLLMRFNGVTSSYFWNDSFASGELTTVSSSMRFTRGNNSSSNTGQIVVDIPNYAATVGKFFTGSGYNNSSATSGNTNLSMYVGGTHATTAITSILIFGNDASNFTAGTYTLYGVK